jgi:hypothetical protein
MSTKVESAPVNGSYIAGPIVVALVMALAIGALAGSLVTRSIVAGGDGTHAPAAFVARGTPAIGWDAQKLEAMEGRAMAEQFRDTVVGLSAADMFALRQGVVPVVGQGVVPVVGLSAAEMFALRQGVVPEQQLQGEQGSAVALTAAEMFALRNGDPPQR